VIIRCAGEGVTATRTPAGHSLRQTNMRQTAMTTDELTEDDLLEVMHAVAEHIDGLRALDAVAVLAGVLSIVILESNDPHRALEFFVGQIRQRVEIGDAVWKQH
jgi:hypothetical protein